MLNYRLIGEVSFEINGFDALKLCERLRKSCKVISLYSKNETVFLTTSAFFEKRVKRLCEENDCVCETVSKRGALYFIAKYLRRYGIIFGAAAAAALIFVLSNTVTKIEIRGTDDPALISEIREVLASEGLSAGSYIPSLNCLALSDRIFSVLDGVAWASIDFKGSVVYVSVSESTQKVEAENMRMPANIVSTKDAVIVDAEVKAGQLSVLLGDAVHKGELLVSGIVDRADGAALYFHAYAKIIGRYEESLTFSQPYNETRQRPGDKTYRRSLGFFELEIPLPAIPLKKGANYSEKLQETQLRFLGMTLPFSLKTREYTEILTEEKAFSTAEALSEAYKLLAVYEKNFLGEVTVISRSVTESITDTGAEVRADYVLEGEIGRSTEIFIK